MYPNTPQGLSDALAAASGDATRIWIDGNVIRVLPAMDAPAVPTVVDFPLIAGEVGVENAGYEWGDIRRYGGGPSSLPAKNTIALNNAILSAWKAKRPVCIPGGTYRFLGGVDCYRSVSIVGDGPQATILSNESPSNYGIRLCAPSESQPYLVGRQGIADLQITGTSTGAAIEFDTEASCALSNLYLIDCAGHGVHIGKTKHASVLTITGTKIQRCKNGVYGRSSYAKQINAVNIINSDISGNTENGVDVLATVLNIDKNVIQNNGKYGVIVSADGYLDGSYTARVVSVSGNYMERNGVGELRVETGIYASASEIRVGYLEVRGNLFSQGASATAPSVSMTRAGDGSSSGKMFSEGVVTGKFTGNCIMSDTSSLAFADFGNALSDSFEVDLGTDNPGLGASPVIYDSRLLKYINLGRARLSAAQNYYVFGWLNSKSDTINYANGNTDSDEFVLSSSEAFVSYNVPLSSNEILISAAIPVMLDSAGASADVSFEIISYPASGNTATTSVKFPRHVVTVAATGNYAVPAIAMSNYIEEVNSLIDVYRASYLREFWVVKVGVRLSSGSPAAKCKLGSLFIRKN